MKIPEITVETLQDWIEKGEPFALLDVREPHELDICKFPQMTHHITMGNLQNRFTDLPEDKPLVVVCRSGVRSLYAVRFLQEESYEKALNLKGGILEYIRTFRTGWTMY